MGIQLPGWLRWVGDLIGEPFPEGDETACRRQADRWRHYADQLEGLKDELNTATHTTLGGFAAGELHNAVDERLQPFTPAIDQVAGQLRQLAEAVDKVATEIEFAKEMFIANLVALAATVGALIATSWINWTAPAEIAAAVAAAEAAISSIIRAAVAKVASEAIARVITELVVRALEGAAVNAVMSGALNAGIQGQQMLQGNRHDFDSTSFWSDVESGAISGAVMGPVVKGAHDFDAGSALGNRAKNFGASFVGNAGGALAAQQALTGHLNLADAAGAGAMFGAVDGMRSPGAHTTSTPESTALTGDRPGSPSVDPLPIPEHPRTPPAESAAAHSPEIAGPSPGNVDVPLNLGPPGHDGPPTAPAGFAGTDAAIAPGTAPHTAPVTGAHPGVADAGPPTAAPPSSHAAPASNPAGSPPAPTHSPSPGTPAPPTARAGVSEAPSAQHAGAPAARTSEPVAHAGSPAKDRLDAVRAPAGAEPATHPVHDAETPPRDGRLPQDHPAAHDATATPDVAPAPDARPARGGHTRGDAVSPARDGAPPREAQPSRDGAGRDERRSGTERVGAPDSTDRPHPTDHGSRLTEDWHAEPARRAESERSDGDAGRPDPRHHADAAAPHDAAAAPSVVASPGLSDAGHSTARPASTDTTRIGGPDRHGGQHDPHRDPSSRRPDSDGYGDDSPPPGPGPVDPTGFDNPANHRIYGPKELAPVEDPAHQTAVRESLLEKDGSYAHWADPRSHPYGGLINDGGPAVAGRPNNCLDSSLAALASFYGEPTVSAPRYEANRLGEASGLARAKAWLGDGLHRYPGLAIPEQFEALHQRISRMGPGSSALVVNGWQKFDSSGKPLFRPDGTPELNGAHATVVVYPRDAAGPVWWDPQHNRTSDHPPPRLVDKSAYLHFTPIAPDHFGPITPQQGGQHGGTGHTRPGTGVSGEDRPGHLLRGPAVRDGMDLLADPDARAGRGQRGGGFDQAGHRFTDGGRDGIPELVDGHGGGGLHRGETDRPPTTGPSDLPVPLDNHPPAHSGGPRDHHLPDESGVAERPAGTHPGPPADHRQADPAQRPAGHTVEHGEGPRDSGHGTESRDLARGDGDGVLNDGHRASDPAPDGPEQSAGHHEIDPADRGRAVASQPDAERSRGMANEALWKRIPPVSPDEVRHHLADNRFGEQRARDNVSWWRELSGEEQRALIDAYPYEIGNAEGVPAWARNEANQHQLSRRLDELQSRKDAGEHLTRAERKELRRYADLRRALDNAKTEAARLGGEVHILAFDPKVFHGDGRMVVSVGYDPHRADSVSWHVPGVTTTIDKLGGNLGNALNHSKSVAMENPDLKAASIAWIGYDAPSGKGIFRMAFHGLASEGGAILHGDIAAFNAAAHNEHFSNNHIFGHSYGSTTTSYAGRNGQLAGHVHSITLAGSPGAALQHHASDFGIGEHVFIASSSRDIVTALGARSPGSLGRFFGVGLGVDPAMAPFGAHRVTAEFPRHMDLLNTFGTHTAYYEFDPALGVRTESLANFGRIAAGHFDEVHIEAHRTERPWWQPGLHTDEPAQGRPLRLDETNGKYSVDRRIWDARWHSGHPDTLPPPHEEAPRADDGTQSDAPVVVAPSRDYDVNGRTIPTDQLSHPRAGLLDQSLLDSAAANPHRVSDALAPGAPRTHPEVQNMLPHSYHPNGGLTQAEWNREYWPTGQRDAHGNPELVWPDPQTHPQGFSSPEDRTPSVLNPGQLFDRFGPGFGVFGSPVGTLFPERALPPHSLDAGYHRYEVMRPIPIWEGRIAPAMGQPGGGIQYYFTRPIVDLVNAGYLKEIPL